MRTSGQKHTKVQLMPVDVNLTFCGVVYEADNNEHKG